MEIEGSSLDAESLSYFSPKRQRPCHIIDFINRTGLLWPSPTTVPGQSFRILVLLGKLMASPKSLLAAGRGSALTQPKLSLRSNKRDSTSDRCGANSSDFSQLSARLTIGREKMRQFEIHMRETTARKLWDKLNADGRRDCGNSMVIVEYDELSRAVGGLRLARSHAEFVEEVYPVRGI